LVFGASKSLEFQNMNDGLHLKEVVRCVLAGFIFGTHQQQK
jgi:hypothetical protein